MKRIIANLLTMVFLLSACSGGSGQKENHTSPAGTEAANGGAPAGTTLRLGLLAGPTGMGGARLLQDAAEGKTANQYQHTIFNAPDEVTAELISGALDIAALPTNLAAVLHKKTEGRVQLLALNTLGVLHLLKAEGERVRSVEDLKGKTLHASGQAAVPEYVLSYILDSYGLKDQVKVVYEAEHDAVIAALAAGKAKLAGIAGTQGNGRFKPGERAFQGPGSDGGVEQGRGKAGRRKGCAVHGLCGGAE